MYNFLSTILAPLRLRLSFIPDKSGEQQRSWPEASTRGPGLKAAAKIQTGMGI